MIRYFDVIDENLDDLEQDLEADLLDNFQCIAESDDPVGFILFTETFKNLLDRMF